MTCVFTRAGFRKRGLGRRSPAPPWTSPAPAARAPIEAYPMTTNNALLEGLHVGTLGMFAAAGFAELSRPTVRRAVMRLDF